MTNFFDGQTTILIF